MSEIFEGVVVPGGLNNSPTFSRDRWAMSLSVEPVGPDAVVIFRDDTRVEAEFTSKIDELATEVSKVTGRALAVRYDSRVGHRSSVLYRNGRVARAFGDDDELFAQLDERGEPILSARPLKREQFQKEAEYETVSNAIQQGLAELAVGDWDTLFNLMVLSA